MPKGARAMAALATWCLVTLAAMLPAGAVKLRISDVECVEKVIDEAESLVSVVLVAGDSEESEAFFDFVVRRRTLAPRVTLHHTETA